MPGRLQRGPGGAMEPGDCLELADGTYTEPLQPTVSGTAVQPITIRAETDGGVLFDGQNSRNPCVVQGEIDNRLHDIHIIGIRCEKPVVQRGQGSLCGWHHYEAPFREKRGDERLGDPRAGFSGCSLGGLCSLRHWTFHVSDAQKLRSRPTQMLGAVQEWCWQQQHLYTQLEC